MHLFRAGAVAVDVIGRAGETRAIAADDRLQGFVKSTVVGIGAGEALAGRFDTGSQPLHVDSQHAAVLDDEAAGPAPRPWWLPGWGGTEAPRSPSRFMSSLSSQTPCATVKSGPRMPSSSRCAVKVLP